MSSSPIVYKRRSNSRGHSFRHRREAPVRLHPGSRPVGSHVALGVEQSEAIWTISKDGHGGRKGKVQDSLRQALKEDTLALPEAPGRASPSGDGRPSQTGGKAGDQERRREKADQDPPGGLAQRRFQGPLGPDEAQDDLPCPVRQRGADENLRRGDQGRAGNHQDPPAYGARPTWPSARPASRRRRRPYPPRS